MLKKKTGVAQDVEQPHTVEQPQFVEQPKRCGTAQRCGTKIRSALLAAWRSGNKYIINI